MDPGEIWTYTCSSAIDVEEANQADISALDHLGGEVADFDVALVIPFVAAIDIEKTANPTLLFGSGLVTYSYEVTNTGEVPLDDVETRVEDDTCASVIFTGGDDDGNGLLTGEHDLFETGPPEIWRFQCTTTISEDTTNTVTVLGTPTGPDADVQAVIGPDVTDSDTAFVEVVQLGSIEITKVAGGADGTFPFQINGQTFELTTVDGSASQTFTDLRPGTFTVTEAAQDEWGLVGIECDDPSGGTTTDDPSATIDLGEGETVTCTFTNTFIPPTDDRVAPAAPVQPPSAAPPAQDRTGFAWLFGGAALAILAVLSLRRRPLAVPWPRRRGR
jgi:hypothetical protein